MFDSLSSKDCFMDWVDVGEGVACHSGDIGGQSLPIPWRTLVLLQHQKVIINTLNTNNFSVQTKIDAFSPEDSAADMTRLKAEYNIFSAKSEEEAHHFLQLETAIAMLGSDKSRAQKLIRGIHGPRPKL